MTFITVGGNIFNMPIKEKTERNQRIKDYHEKHPKASIRAIGRMFKLSHVRILAILKDNGNKKRMDMK